MERPYSLVYLIVNAAKVLLMIFDVHISETMSLKEYTNRRIMLSVRKDMGYLEIEHMSTTSTQHNRL
jgi:hypothetical protein